MAISYVGEAEFTYAGTANTTITVRIPSGIQVGDLLICGHGNVSSHASGVTMNNSWTKLEEVGIDSTNCYFLMAAKIATATEVSLAGSTQQIATAPDTAGGTNKTTQCVAYRGTYSTVALAVPLTNVKHETSPADQTIETNSVTPNDNNQWLTTFFNMASGGDQDAASFSSSGYTFRGDAKLANGTSTTSAVSCYDSNGTVAQSSTQRSGTWSSTATRLNGAIAVIAGSNTKSGTDTATRTETQTISATFNRSDTASGNQTQTITGSFSRSDTATRTESHTIGASFDTSDVSSETETQSLIVYISDSDVGVAQDFAISPDQGTPAEIGDYASTLVMGPATIYVADYGAPEPLDLAVGSVPSAAFWTDIGGTFDGVRLRIQYQYKPSYDPKRLVQNPERTNDRLKKRIVSVITKLAEPSLMNLLYAINEGTVTSGAGYTSFIPTMVDRATPLTYRAVIIDGWAPGLKSNGRHKRRRVILRKCLSSADVVMAYTEKKQTFQTITWIAHNVDGVTSPFKIIDEV